MKIYEQLLITLYGIHKEDEFTFFHLDHTMRILNTKELIIRKHTGVTEYHYFQITPEGIEMAKQLIEFMKL